MNEGLGYTQFFEENRSRLELGDLPVARVVSQSRGIYTVKNEKGEYSARITGKQMFDAELKEDYPAVGDWVLIEKTDENQALIRGILPRFSILKRKYGDKNKAGEKEKTQVIATNIDVAFVVESVDRDYNLNRIERYFALVQDGGVKPVVILNKVDLISKEELEEKSAELRERFPDTDLIFTSTHTNEGLEDLEKYISENKTYCFLGSSGVGKSSLINKLLGEEAAKTGDISSYSERGRHVTTSRQMYFLENGGILVDNPGMREVGIVDTDSGIEDSFDEITELSQGCKYSNCTHSQEPGCKVLDAVRSGALDEGKYANYMNLKKEDAYYDMNDFEKRRKDKKFGKLVKNVKKDLKKFGNKDW